MQCVSRSQDPKIVAVLCVMLLLSCVTRPISCRNKRGRASSRRSEPRRGLITPVSLLIREERSSRNVNRVKVNMSDFDVTSSPTNTRKVKLFCRTGYFLRLQKNGKVNGTVGLSDAYVYFQMQAVGRGIIRLKGLKSDLYVCMDKRGRVFGKSKYSRECLFQESQEENAFRSYASIRYYRLLPFDMLIGIKESGIIKKGKLTSPGQSAVQFVVIDVTTYDI